MGYTKNMTDAQTLLLTVHGSHLYGMNHAGSDLDYYRVLAVEPQRNIQGDIRKKNATHVVEGNNDNAVFDFKTFAIHAYNCVPQALEAMYSPLATIDAIGAYRLGFRASVQTMSVKYIHAIEKFSNFEFKKRRHALRYALNLNEAINNNGRFSPVLSENDKLMISEMAASVDYISHLRKLSYFDLNLNEDAIANSIQQEQRS